MLMTSLGEQSRVELSNGIQKCSSGKESIKILTQNKLPIPDVFKSFLTTITQIQTLNGATILFVETVRNLLSTRLICYLFS
jgi:hypothetical protein